MKNVLILGAGMVARPMVRYLLKKNYRVTIASRTRKKAVDLIEGHPNGTALTWTADREKMLADLVRSHDIVVSLLPYAHHIMVARLCIQFGKDLVTTSYVKPEMKALDKDAKKAGIIILNELGLDPGIDHMSAKRIIDEVHDKGGRISQFYSCTGALAAPEVEKNPFNYKFTWSPEGVLLAGNNDGRYLEDGQEKYVPTDKLFSNPRKARVTEVGELEVYPNRDSLPYIELYEIPEVQTMYRGTFRYPNWCEIMDAFKRLDLYSSSKEFDMEGWTAARFISSYCGLKNGADLREQLAVVLGMNSDDLPLKALDWLGMFSPVSLQLKRASAFDVLSELMIPKMLIREHERDMVVMQHVFHVNHTDGSSEVITSEMLDFGTLKTDTSVSRTVSLPAACGVEMILEKKVTIEGVHIPVIPEIYNPIMDSLEKMGIKMKENYGMAESKMVN